MQSKSQNVEDKSKTVTCPICEKQVRAVNINEHLDNACSDDAQSPLDSTASDPQGLHRSHICKPESISKQTKKHASSHIAPIFQVAYKQTANAKSTPSSIVNSAASSSSSMKKRPSQDIAPSFNTMNKRSKAGNTTGFQTTIPLAERLRPHQLAEFIGQSHLLAPDSLLTMLLQSKSQESLILWGPPGCGKTSLARLISQATGNDTIFKELSASNTSSGEVRAILEESKNALLRTGRQTTLFMDEIHRFNRAQQDVFLPYVEQGHIRLIGATTENPSFKITAALLSRCRVLVLEPLGESEMMKILRNAISAVGGSSLFSVLEVPIPFDCSTKQDDKDSHASNLFPHITLKVLSTIISLAVGDARKALSLLDIAIKYPNDGDENALVTSLKRSVAVAYDRSGENHYDMISALHKSVRGSNPDAALYWLARMLNAGEDPLYIVRRMIVCASEDIGLADVHALPLATATLQACQVIGMPECRINLAHLVVYLSEARKSTRAYEAYKRAEEAAKLDLSIPVPFQMRNAPTNLMKELGYGRDYAYNPGYAHPVHNTYLPIQIQGNRFLRKEDDFSDKIWDENALRHWELEVNEGRDWEGRKLNLDSLNILDSPKSK